MQSGHSSIVSPAYAGVALLFAWTYLTFYANTAGIEAAAPISLMSAAYSVSAIFMLVPLLAIAFSKRIGARHLTSIPVKVAAPLGMSMGTALLVINGFDYANDFSTGLVLAGGILTGVSSGVMTQQWVLAYSRIGLKTAACSFPMLMATAVGVSITLMYLPSEVLFLAMTVLPAASELMFHSVRHAQMPYCDIDTNFTDSPINFILLLLPVIVFSLASGFLDYFSAVSAYTFVFYALVSFIPLAAAAIFILRCNREEAVPALLIPACFLLVLFIPFFTLFNATPAATFISIGELGMEAVLFLCTIGFAEFFSLSPFKTYALSRLLYAALSSLGWYLAGFSTQALSSLANSLASLTIVLISIEVLSVALIVAVVKAQKNIQQEDQPFERVESGMLSAASQLGRVPDVSNRHSAAAPSATHGAPDAAGNPEQERDSRKPESAPTPPSRVNAPERGETASASETETHSPLPDHLGASLQGGPETETAMSNDFQNTFNERCTEIGKQYGLSHREVDVLSLLALGYSSARIQSELYIAAGTVNYHTRNIYAKLGVHSKQEVIDLVRQGLD